MQNKMVLKGARLRPGDTLSVVAPSGPIPPGPFRDGLALLQSRYHVIFDEKLLHHSPPESGTQGGTIPSYLAADDETRFRELEAALSDPRVGAVIMARGGYGLLRILERFDPAWLRQHAKPFVGFSDGTLFLALLALAGIASVHGPVVTQLGRLPPADRQALYPILEEPSPSLLLQDLECLCPGQAEGPLLGGNVEVFSRLLGTPFLPNLQGAILLLEDVGEQPYRVDRLLTQFFLAGVFRQVAGVLVGDFVGCDDPARNIYPTGIEVVRERLAKLTIPVVMGVPAGHGTRNHPLPYGTRMRLDGRAGVLEALEGVVA